MGDSARATAFSRPRPGQGEVVPSGTRARSTEREASRVVKKNRERRRVVRGLGAAPAAGAGASETAVECGYTCLQVVVAVDRARYL